MPASQLRGAVESGLAVALLPESYVGVRAVVPVRFSKPLAGAASEWLADEAWLVGHRALRDVPRVAAVWTFLLEEVDALGGVKRGRSRR